MKFPGLPKLPKFLKKPSDSDSSPTSPNSDNSESSPEYTIPDPNQEHSPHDFDTLVKTLAKETGINLDSDSTYAIELALIDNAKSLSECDPAALESMFKLLGNIPNLNPVAANHVFSRSPEATASCLTGLQQFYDNLPAELRPTTKGDSAEALHSTAKDSSVEKFANAYILYFNPETFSSPDFISQLSRATTIAANLPAGQRIFTGTIADALYGISKNHSDTSSFGDFVDLCQELTPDQTEITGTHTKLSLINSYTFLHGLTEDTIPGFIHSVFPALEQGNTENLHGILDDRKAFYGNDSNPYAYSIGDYTLECLLSHPTPANIDKLNRIYHELPTSDYQKYEQNRRDAVRLEGTVIGSREFIHDELPGAHEILVALESYYDASQSSPAEQAEAEARLATLAEKYPSYDFMPNHLSPELFEQPITTTGLGRINREAHDLTVGDDTETAIDILRRMVANTNPDSPTPPTTSFPNLNQLMSDIHPRINPETGAIRVSLREIGPAVAEFNQIILSAQGHQGLMPSTISAVAFLDKMSSEAIRSLGRKDLSELIYDPNFKEILRFSQLTSSIGYNETAFESFYQAACDQFSQAYGGEDIDYDQIRDGWRLIGQHISQNMSSLGSLYASHPNTERFTNAVWSGNLAKTLISSFERIH